MAQWSLSGLTRLRISIQHRYGMPLLSTLQRMVLPMNVDGGEVQKDDLGNGLGGVRLPSLEVPTNIYTSGNRTDPTLPDFLQRLGNLACFLAGSVEPLDEATLNMLYRNNGVYRSQISHPVKSLKSEGLLLQGDAIRIKALASKWLLD